MILPSVNHLLLESLSSQNKTNFKSFNFYGLQLDSELILKRYNYLLPFASSLEQQVG